MPSRRNPGSGPIVESATFSMGGLNGQLQRFVILQEETGGCYLSAFDSWVNGYLVQQLAREFSSSWKLFVWIEYQHGKFNEIEWAAKEIYRPKTAFLITHQGSLLLGTGTLRQLSTDGTYHECQLEIEGESDSIIKF